MYPVLRSPEPPIQTPIPDKHITIYVLLAGVAGGLVLAVAVMVCCKSCLKKKTPLTRQHVIFSRSSEFHSSQTRKYHSLDSSVSVDIETSCGFHSDGSTSPRNAKEHYLEEGTRSLSQYVSPRSLPSALSDISERKTDESGSKRTTPTNESVGSEHQPLDRPSAKNPSNNNGRSSLTGIQRQNSVCLSDDESAHVTQGSPSSRGGYRTSSPGSSSGLGSPGPSHERTRVQAIVHETNNGHSVRGKIQLSKNGGADSQQSSHSHSSLDSGSTRTIINAETLRAEAKREWTVGSPLYARLPPGKRSCLLGMDLEHYHYKAQKAQATLASQLPSPLCEKSSSSLEIAGTGSAGSWAELPSPMREAVSTERGILERNLEAIRQQSLHRMQQSDLRSSLDDGDGDKRSVVRYNDTGSLEEVNEKILDSPSPESDSKEDIPVSVEVEAEVEVAVEAPPPPPPPPPPPEPEELRFQYKKLWELRATFEEEEDVEEPAKTPRLAEPEDLEDEEEEEVEMVAVSQDPSPDRDQGTSYTTSFESNTEAVAAEEDACPSPGDPTPDSGSSEPPRVPATTPTTSSNLLQLPTTESRRHSYQSLLTRRLRRLAAPGKQPPSTSTETSLDSVDAEGSSTEASRTDGGTTSFDSTTGTDNTDSTSESHNHKLQQMKADSGYKSMESATGYKSLEGNGKPPKLYKRQVPLTEDDEGVELFELSQTVESIEEVEEGSLELPETPLKMRLTSPSSLLEQEFLSSSKKTSPQDVMETSLTISPKISPDTEKVLMASGAPQQPHFTTLTTTLPSGSNVITTTTTLSKDEVVEPRKPRTASKKRRQYLREKHVMQVLGGSLEAFGSPSTPEEPCYMPRGKSSVFLRFFRSGKMNVERVLMRDYSIDEKSDALFREFSRQDPSYELETGGRRAYTHLRLHHESPRLQRKVISPQQSIEEEEGSQSDEERRAGAKVLEKARAVSRQQPVSTSAGTD